MQEIFQQTLAEPIKFVGIGLHSDKILVTTIPAKAGHGILFKRIDLKNNNIVEANTRMYPANYAPL